MKSQLFKTAWTLAKQLKMSFSEALTKAWAAFKADSVVAVRKTWGGVTLISYRKQVSNVTVFAGSLSEVIAKAKASEPINNNGAAAYYGVGVYNGD